MTAVEITSTSGIQTVAPDVVEAIDALALTLGAGPWQIDVLIGRTPTDTVHITARPITTERTHA